MLFLIYSATDSSSIESSLGAALAFPNTATISS